MIDADYKLTRIGVFYDGNFFARVSNYIFFLFHAEIVNADFNGLKPGERVRFQLDSNPRGPRAVQVSVLE
jgi:'Cold-shock' DNA-binding domain